MIWLGVEVEGPGELRFAWRVSGVGREACVLIVDGRVARVLRPGPGWEGETLTLGAGDHTVRWVFTGGAGAAFVDRVWWGE